MPTTALMLLPLFTPVPGTRTQGSSTGAPARRTVSVLTAPLHHFASSSTLLIVTCTATTGNGLRVASSYSRPSGSLTVAVFFIVPLSDLNAGIAGVVWRLLACQEDTRLAVVVQLEVPSGLSELVRGDRRGPPDQVLVVEHDVVDAQPHHAGVVFDECSPDNLVDVRVF